MRAVDVIRAKRDGEVLSPEAIGSFVAGVLDGTWADYQTSALLMAIVLRGMTAGETAALTDAMVRSGRRVDLSGIPGVKVGKHSTGGVGDKVSIVLAPLVAACGVVMPKMSGRGLGHTGGTLDKLESIPGFRVDLPVERFAALVEELGACLIGQTARVAPADKRLYALRDVTGTVESIPLIASSIMSKKLAEGIDGLVLDVKVGAGAFMKDVARARALCAAMRAIGVGAGKRVTCVLTDMDAPIGTHVGNALEIAESIEVMRGGGPADTRELTVVLGAEMLLLAGVERDPDAAAARIGKSLDDGSALAVFAKIVAAQGGDPRVCEAPAAVLPQPRRKVPIVAPRAGNVAAMVADEIGMAALVLGAGRGKQDDRIDPAVGLVLAVRPGDRVAAGDLLATAWCDDDDARLAACRDRVLAAVHLVDHAVPPPPASRVIETIR